MITTDAEKPPEEEERKVKLCINNFNIGLKDIRSRVCKPHRENKAQNTLDPLLMSHMVSQKLSIFTKFFRKKKEKEKNTLEKSKYYRKLEKMPVIGSVKGMNRMGGYRNLSSPYKNMMLLKSEKKVEEKSRELEELNIERMRIEKSIRDREIIEKGMNTISISQMRRSRSVAPRPSDYTSNPYTHTFRYLSFLSSPSIPQ